MGKNRRMTKQDDRGGGRNIEERESRKGKEVCGGKQEVRKLLKIRRR
jgi:hypothetical protein